MDVNNMKNMIVLKNLPSNMIEEAFVVLKSNVKIHKLQLLENKKIKTNEQEVSITKDCVVREAELIIQEYINKTEKKDNMLIKNNKNMTIKYKRLKAMTIFLTMFLFVSIILNFIK